MPLSSSPTPLAAASYPMSPTPPLAFLSPSVSAPALMAAATLLLNGCATPPHTNTNTATATSSPTPTLSLSPSDAIALHASQAHTREFSAARIQAQGDLNRDGIPDTIIIYRLEGDPSQDGFEQFLLGSLSPSAGRPAVLIPAVRVGYHGGPSVSSARIQSPEGMVELNTQEYLSTDKSCCPTGRGIQQWKLEQQSWISAATSSHSLSAPTPTPNSKSNSNPVSTQVNP